MKNNTKITAKEIEEYRQYEQANTEIKNTYRSLIVAVLNVHKVRSIVRVEDVAEKFFDTIEVNEDGTLTVDRHGLKLDNLYFDFTCDFARCLSYIEDEIFMQERKGKSQHGYKVTFRK